MFMNSNFHKVTAQRIKKILLREKRFSRAFLRYPFMVEVRCETKSSKIADNPQKVEHYGLEVMRMVLLLSDDDLSIVSTCKSLLMDFTP